ncbi:hypothetical protein GCM10018779_32790 [Streptomyces griseocarneus]|nr:hypothetical protein GCM10018779_32790 [Streptomyces griseocarneus]
MPCQTGPPVHPKACLAPLLPQVNGRGRQWRDHRQVVNGVLRHLRTGAPWRDLPERYGPWQTAYKRFCQWESDGTWAHLLEHIVIDASSIKLLTITVGTAARVAAEAGKAASAETAPRVVRAHAPAV